LKDDQYNDKRQGFSENQGDDHRRKYLGGAGRISAKSGDAGETAGGEHGARA